MHEANLRGGRVGRGETMKKFVAVTILGATAGAAFMMGQVLGWAMREALA